MSNTEKFTLFVLMVFVIIQAVVIAAIGLVLNKMARCYPSVSRLAKEPGSAEARNLQSCSIAGPRNLKG